ncbi:MAG: hypothetical protein ABI680_13405 [Chthoniobacteraceae bacterium]
MDAARTRVFAATADDDPAIRRLLRETPMRGAVSVGFEREPNYFRGADLAGGVDQTIVAFDAGRLICVGRCTRRPCWVNGGKADAGYLGELRLAGDARGRFRILRDGYRFFHTQQGERPAAFYFTSIAADNERARRVLESGVRGLPRYRFLAELNTVLIAVPRRPRSGKLNVRAACLEDLPTIVRILNEQARRRQLAAVWTEETLRALERHGLPLDRFLIVLDGDEVVACGALWDQRAFRQTVIQGYALPLSFARPILNAASVVLGIPRLPPPNTVLAHAFLSPLAFVAGSDELLPDFVAASLPLAARIGLEFLTLAVPANDARLPSLRRRFSTRIYRSRLYRVDWPGESRLELDPHPSAFLPDVALL